MMTEQAEKMMGILDQDEANYTPVSTVKGKACSSCLWWRENHCHIVVGYPEPIAPNGYCDRHEIATPLNPNSQPAIPVSIVEPEMQMGAMSLEATKTVDEDGLFARLWERIKETIAPKSEGAFVVQKDLNGEWRWRATFTNNFKDREGEIISEKALDGYLKRVEMGIVPTPELWIGHVEGTKQGVADLVFGLGNFVTAVGHFDSPEMGDAAAKFARKYPNVPLSHGFTFPKWAFKEGVYDVVNVFEISLLPPPLVASNPFTEFEVKTMEKELSPKTEAALALYFGKDKAQELKTNLLARSEETKEAGHAFKDFAEVTEQPAEAAAEETPAVSPAPAVAELLTQILEGQAELERLLGASGKAYTALKAQAESDKATADARVKALETTVEKVQAELKLTPRAASAASETKLSDAEAAAVKQEQANSELDPFWKA